MLYSAGTTSGGKHIGKEVRSDCVGAIWKLEKKSIAVKRNKYLDS